MEPPWKSLLELYAKFYTWFCCGRFDIVSRRAHGPTLGMRWVAGRVVNESYGAGKQQHTFTVSGVWRMRTL